ncbi:murein hydrolase activator EnvC family protein [Mycobacterium sp. smrl_JER01]|uniref:murein hydrolase activator EnvC family protein n=1 Tax=Mycobacterium sp. smrl_JER01 TaxID=3402633 RepID=UPI003AC686CE
MHRAVIRTVIKTAARVSVVASVLVAVPSLTAAPASGGIGRLGWPLHPRPAVLRQFDAPTPNWQRGHRGVDLAGVPGQTVFAAAEGTVVFAGTLAGRPLVSIAHPGGLRTTYEPIEPAVRRGQWVTFGSAVGALSAGHPGCAAAACLHWGAMWGSASRAAYVDPLGLVATTPPRLKPVR